MSRILRKVGAEDISEAADGQQALDRLESGALPDIALVDWNMPVMNGLEFVVNVRQRPRGGR